ncbi:ATP-dependent RNA helicase ddx54 isoform X1 [Drosophila gunungcola]|uniref:ATP-dependent RNA helicase ddx54 isoform X1 n=1 Tax=Drosophila gunungcola TaxID=103775 RepID=UPI0022E294B4|nr:ATP-dependent RNA helicase ddx54 isoform X1 [Drosophila gunungcola]
MDWQPCITAGLICLLLPSQISLSTAWSLPARHSDKLALAPAPVGQRLNEVSPYLDLALCPIRAEPWTCARQQSGRILDAWDGELHLQWQKLKVEADRQMNATIERRGYSTSELPVKEKPSTLLKKIEIGTNYMKKYLAESMDGFLGREYEYLQTPKAADDDSETDQSGNSVEDDDEADAADDASNAAEEENADDEDADGDANNEEEDEDEDDDDQEDEEDDSDSTAEQEKEPETEPQPEDEDEDVDEAVSAPESENEKENSPSVFSGPPAAQPQSGGKNPVFSEDNTSTGVEFIELDDAEENAAGALKKPGGGKRKKNKKGGKRKKNKKKGQGHDTQPATLVVVQAAPEHHEVDSGHDHGSSVISHGSSDDDDHEPSGKPMRKRKQKRRMKGKRKRKGQHGQGSTSVGEHEQSDLSLGLGLLDELADADDVFSGVGGGKRKHRNPLNYGRSNGVTRGKKKKKKKAIAKLVMIGSILKAKIELLLKILGAHLQVKFFAIALIGLLINIARFWIDVKRGSPPAKVVYVEHAHHQHHYEDHGDDWSEQGSYWKRSLQTDPSIEEVDSSTDSYQVRQQPQQQSQVQDPHYLAYRSQYNQWH